MTGSDAYEISPATPDVRDEGLDLLMAQMAEHAIETPRAHVGAALDALLRGPDRGRVLIARRRGTAVGIAVLSFSIAVEHGGRIAWLDELFVDPAHREAGVGTALLRAAIDAADAAGVLAVELEVEAGHERAANLYAREGFARRARERWVRPLPRPAPAQPQDAASAAAAGFEGGCLCGAARYRASAPPVEVVHCHCSLCRRSTGAPFVTWATFAAEAFEFTAGAPVVRRSTPSAERGFCAACGTALTFRDDARPGWIDVTVGSLDTPDRLAPQEHIWTRSALRWVTLDDALPRFERSHPRER